MVETNPDALLERFMRFQPSGEKPEVLSKNET
jgi:hypothetical protein